MFRHLRSWLVLLAAVAIYNCSSGQSIVRSSISCLGSTYAENGIMIRQTIGQSSNTMAFNSGSIHLLQGFQQPLYNLSSLETGNPIDFEIFPNPSKGKSLLRVNEDIDFYTVSVYDSKGKILKILPGRTLPSTWLDLEHYIPGSYIIIVTTPEKTGSKILIII